MGALESFIWHTLGYAAMPMIFLGGFMGVFVVASTILKLAGHTPIED
jgi:uncharacterized protein (TIGR02808 family)